MGQGAVPEGAGTGGRGGLVLVVDDDDGVRQSVVALLRSAGLDAVACDRASAAVPVAAARRPDVAVVDYRLPDGDGLQLAARLRALDAKLPVLLLTGHVSTESAVASVGQLDAYLVKPVDPVLLVQTVCHALDRRRLAEDNDLLLDRLGRLNTYQALHDPLTGLPNRALLEDRLDQALGDARWARSQVAVLFVDLDRFKVVNDARGHHTGDELLVTVATRLVSRCRAQDTVARFGGDEFVVVCQDMRPASAAQLADQLLGALAEPAEVGGAEHRLTASIGIAVADPRDGRHTPETLLRDADVAMYRAKDAGGGTWRLYDGTMRTRVRVRLDTEQGLRVAVERGELVLAYQPVVDLATGHLHGAEALVRWDRPGHGLLPPAAFLPVAEDAGLMTVIDRWVLERALLDLGAARAAGAVPRGFRLWVNVSPHLLADRSLADDVLDGLRAQGLPPSALGIEVVEEAITDPGAAERNLRQLRAAGVAVALDDFGTGHSSLARLVELPITGLKIDREFVAGLDRAQDEDPGAAVVVGILGLARALQLSLVAEGVETDRQAATLRALGCEQAQGYLFARPGPIDRLWEATVEGAVPR